MRASCLSLLHQSPSNQHLTHLRCVPLPGRDAHQCLNPGLRILPSFTYNCDTIQAFERPHDSTTASCKSFFDDQITTQHIPAPWKRVYRFVDVSSGCARVRRERGRLTSGVPLSKNGRRRRRSTDRFSTGVVVGENGRRLYIVRSHTSRFAHASMVHSNGPRFENHSVSSCCHRRRSRAGEVLVKQEEAEGREEERRRAKGSTRRREEGRQNVVPFAPRML